MAEFLTALLNTLDLLPFGWLTLAVLVFMTFETSLLVGLLIPGDVVVLAAGTTARSWEEVILLVISAGVGTLAGQSGGYLVGKIIGPRIRSGFLQRWITDDHWRQAEKLLKRGAGPGILAAQFLPFVHATLPVVAGIIKLEYRQFALWTGIGSALWAMVYVGAGAFFGQVVRANPSQIGWITLLGVLLISGLWFVGYMTDRLLLRRHPKRKSNP